MGLDDSIIENCYTYTAECTSIFAEVFLIDRQVNNLLIRTFLIFFPLSMRLRKIMNNLSSRRNPILFKDFL